LARELQAFPDVVVASKEELIDSELGGDYLDGRESKKKNRSIKYIA